MRVLLMSITAGQGHHATAQALEARFHELGHSCTTVDTLEYASPILKEMVDKGYLVSTAYMPKAFGKVYHFADRKTTPAHRMSMTNLTSHILTHELRDFIDDCAPDIIVCTHPFPAVIIDSLKRKDRLDAITVGVLTDFTIHPFWENTQHLDYYVTASELMGIQLRRKHLDDAKMLPFGIPIHPKFSTKMDQREARRALGLAEDKKTLLVMSGSMGFGKIDRSIEKLDELDMDFQGLVVCGNNKEMYRKISAMELHKDFRIFGYVNNVDVMMDAADCIITKPGGITSSEALAKELPMIMVNPIPGQEERNVEFLLNNQLAMYATRTYPVDEAVYTLFGDGFHLENLRRNIRELGKKNASQRICDFLVERVMEKKQHK
ncbi:MAG: MGDG synthase family glycosyltransferase [Eubacteriales bacterium]